MKGPPELRQTVVMCQSSALGGFGQTSKHFRVKGYIMRKSIFLAAMLSVLLLAMPAFSQDASLGGTVTDTTGGVLPGATVTATNESTGVVSTSVTNAAGVYSFPRLLFGSYTVKAELPGFQIKTFTNVRLEWVRRLNFELESAAWRQTLRSRPQQSSLLESSSSVGDVLPAGDGDKPSDCQQKRSGSGQVMSGVM